MSSIVVDLGAATAYAEAVAGGYTGTKAEFAEDMGNSATNASVAATSADLSEAYAKGTVDGDPVSSGDPGYEDNAKYYAQQAATSAASVHPSDSDDIEYILGT